MAISLIDFSFKSHPITLLLSLLSTIYIIRRLAAHWKGQLPPGPRGLPIIGNFFQLSATLWIEFDKWKKAYGPLVYITAFGQGMLIINTHKAAADLLDRRGTKYGDRPRWIVASEILSGGMIMPFSKQNDTFRRMRRAGVEGLRKSTVPKFYPFQLREALILVDEVLRAPNKWSEAAQRATASMVLSAVYDLPPTRSYHDPIIVKVNDFLSKVIYAMFPGNYFVEFLTWMKYLPSSIAMWKKRAEEGYEIISEMFVGMFKAVEDRIAKGDERPSFAGTLIRERDRYQLSDKEAAWLSATLFAAGVETTSSVLSWFILAMVVYPDTQKRCQDELDAIVGRGRMPTFKDREHLPYICATVREILRWAPVMPLGIQHYTIEDDWYEGYFIPKGTVCFANLWSLNRDPEVYGSDSMHFRPDRFIDPNGQLTPALADTKDGHVTFGFGPRICPGRHLANDTLFITIACLLWTTKISPTLDASGKPIIPDASTTVNAGVVIRPVSFDCSIKYRFPEAEAIFEQTTELNV